MSPSTPSWADGDDWLTSSPATDTPTVNQPRQPRNTSAPTVNKTRVGGGFNPSVNPSFNISMTKNGTQGTTGNSAGQAASAPSGRGGSVPGADFMSNEDIRAFCEYHRKKSRNEATELAMDADHLEAVLKTIPDTTGSRSGSRARARRVTRWIKKASAAKKNSQKYFAMAYGTFEREFEPELRTINKARPKQNHRAPFKFN